MTKITITGNSFHNYVGEFVEVSESDCGIHIWFKPPTGIYVKEYLPDERGGRNMADDTFKTLINDYLSQTTYDTESEVHLEGSYEDFLCELEVDFLHVVTRYPEFHSSGRTDTCADPSFLKYVRPHLPSRTYHMFEQGDGRAYLLFIDVDSYPDVKSELLEIGTIMRRLESERQFLSSLGKSS